MRTAITRLARLPIARLALALALGLCAAPVVACGGTAPNAAVTIMIPWDPKTDPGEYNAFIAVINRFEHKNGIKVIPQVTRAVTQELDADLAAGDPPDVVDLPNPGTAEQYKGNGLMPLRQISLRDYAEPWRGLATLGTGTVYVVPVKADVKGLIWYSTSAITSPPASWAALEKLSKRGTPWCLGLASGAASGWPGADWIADILLSRYPVGVYEEWLHGELAWNSPQVTDAWQEWGALMRYGAAINGGVPGALETSYNQTLPGGRCVLDHGALSATGLKSTVGYSYVRFPSASGAASPAMVSGDFMGLFTRNPNARKLLTYLASTKAQTLWVSQLRGHAFSADEAVKPADYPRGVQRNIAALLQPGAGATLCFSGGDLMVSDVSAAFSQAALDYVNNRHSLGDLLRSLQQTQQGADSSPVWNLACSGRGAS
jgi:alpha-glucoside transport system substrate-binding protein